MALGLKMLKLFILTIFISTVRSGEDVDRFLGKWWPIYVYTKHNISNNDCEKISLTSQGYSNCTCNGEQKKVALVAIKEINSEGHPDINLATVTTDPSEVNNELYDFAFECRCEQYHKHVIFRYLNDNYIMLYSPTYDGHEYASLYAQISSGIVLAKEKPTVTEFEDFLKQLDYERNKIGHYVCADLNP